MELNEALAFSIVLTSIVFLLIKVVQLFTKEKPSKKNNKGNVDKDGNSIRETKVQGRKKNSRSNNKKQKNYKNTIVSKKLLQNLTSQEKRGKLKSKR